MTKRILILDDDRDFSDMVAARCRKLGADVATAHTPLEAMELLGQRMPDLICLDVNMPTENGLNICEYLGSSPHTKHVPVVILTGRADGQTVRRCNELRAAYVHKSPSFWSRLRPVIVELMDLHVWEADELALGTQ
ncbi:MAG: response regulator [Pirellulaceae bacterium]|nr:response regulator [Planctomycetales bacterium]